MLKTHTSKSSRLWLALFFIAFSFLGACNHVVSSSLDGAPLKLGHPEQVINGKASWYGHPFHGRKTANGEIYNMYSMTAAHKSLPFGSLLKVTNLSNSRELIVRVNDRGPYRKGVMLDLSYAAAQELGMVQKGVSQVKIEVYSPQRLSVDISAPEVARARKWTVSSDLKAANIKKTLNKS